MNVSANAVTSHSDHRLPSLAITANAQTAMERLEQLTSHRALDRPHRQREEARPSLQFERLGEGRVPSLTKPVFSQHRPPRTLRRSRRSDRASCSFEVPVRTGSTPVETIANTAERSDPRQMLMLVQGSAADGPGQVEAMKYEAMRARSSPATPSATRRGGPSDRGIDLQLKYRPTSPLRVRRKAMFGAGKLPDYKSLEAQLKTASTRLREPREACRLGFVFCPTHDPRSRHPSLQAFSRNHRPKAQLLLADTETPTRLQQLHPPPSCPSLRPRSARVHQVESEGFDKNVIATTHGWLGRRYLPRIWEWRHNKWRIMTESPLGMIGSSARIRDLV